MRAEHLYVHVPFCARRCVYCDFSIAVRSRIPVAEYLTALEAEWDRHRESELELSTVYFGGGTPSKLGADGVARLLDLTRRHAQLRDNAEITLEANPEDVSAESVRSWLASGINRISLGVQSFQDEVLRWMHRTHDAKTAWTAVQVLREQGISNISIDLIFATTREVPRSWELDVETAIDLDLPHVSVYGMTVETHTPLGRRVARRDAAEAPEESFEDEFLLAHDRLTRSGFEHYEVSNYGKANRHSRHNWSYWSRKPYAGLGPSAHEFDGRMRRWNTPPYADWVSRTSRGVDPVEGCEALTREQSDAEKVYLSLRTTGGLAITEQEHAQASRWVEAGWATISEGSVLRLTAEGWLRLDSLAGDLTLFRSR